MTSSKDSRKRRTSKEMVVAFEVRYVPLPPERESDWHSAMQTIADLLYEGFIRQQSEPQQLTMNS
jgi:hypothetical protein